MAKHLSRMTWKELQAEMSIAGNPDKFAALGNQIELILLPAIDHTNRAELTNAVIMLRRLVAEIKLAQRMYDKSH
jgi:hypothetical protein